MRSVGWDVARPFAVVVLIVGSGCLSVSSSDSTSGEPRTSGANLHRDPADGRDAGIEHGAPLRLVKTLVLTDTQGFEPSVKVDASGTIYATASKKSLTDASWLWVSQDGVVFKSIDVASAENGVRGLPLGLEGDVAVDAAGQAYFVDMQHFAGAALAQSTDRGKTWMLRNPNAWLQPVADRPWIAAGAKDVVALTWQHLLTGMWVAVSTDGGLTFRHTFIPGYGAINQLDNEWAKSGPITIANDGTIYVARSHFYASAEDLGPHVWRSSDGGATFTRHSVHSSKNFTRYPFVVPAVDEAGIVYVAWAENVADNVEVFYAYSVDKGSSWSRPIQVSRHLGSSVMPWIAAGKPGHVALAYYGAPNATGEPAATDAEWFPFAADVINAATDDPDIVTLPLASSAPIKGPICAEGLFCNGQNRELLDYLMVDIGPKEEVHVVWGTKEGSIIWSQATRLG